LLFNFVPDRFILFYLHDDRLSCLPGACWHVPGFDKGSGLYFHVIKSGTTTPGGLLARTVVTSLLHSQHYVSALQMPTGVWLASAATSVQMLYVKFLYNCF